MTPCEEAVSDNTEIVNAECQVFFIHHLTALATHGEIFETVQDHNLM